MISFDRSLQYIIIYSITVVCIPSLHVYMFRNRENTSMTEYHNLDISQVISYNKFIFSSTYYLIVVIH